LAQAEHGLLITRTLIARSRNFVSSSLRARLELEARIGRRVDTQTLHSGIYAFTFDQKGLMAGLGIEGSKIERIGQ
jgi:lipid-binding SYLF domain-containing protein